MEETNDLEKDLLKNFDDHKMEFLCIHGNEEPEGIYIGLVKDAEDYYHVVFDNNMEVRFISVVGRCNYYKNYFDKLKYSVVNYLLKNDKEDIIERIREKVSQRLTDKEKLLKFYV